MAYTYYLKSLFIFKEAHTFVPMSDYIQKDISNTIFDHESFWMDTRIYFDKSIHKIW